MATIKKFEDILAWQEARKLAKMVYAVTREGSFARDFGLKDQIQRAAVSVGSNIAEGFERSGNREFAKFLWIAKGSSGEVVSQLYTAKDIGYITDEQLNILATQARHCSYLIYKLVSAVKSSPVTGDRYK